MERYSFLKYSEYDKVYYKTLYEAGRKGGNFEGKVAVDFLKLSGVTPVCFPYDQVVYRRS